MVESRCSESALVITYASFPMARSTDVGDIGVEYHITNIIQHVLIGLITRLKDGPSVHLRDTERDALRQMTRTYITDVDRTRLNDSINAVRSFTQTQRDFWLRWTERLGTVAAFAWDAFLGQPGPGALVLREEEDPIQQEPIRDFEALGNIAQASGIESVYVLVDRVDEIEQTQNDREAAYQFVRPLLTNLSVIELRPYAFKFFLTDDLQGLWLEGGGRSDRIRTYHSTWSRDELVNLIDKRLTAFSSTDEALHVDLISGRYEWLTRILSFSQNSPRDLIRILGQIVAEQLRRRPESSEITDEAREAGINEFCRNRAVEIAGSRVLDQLRRIHLADFTVARAVENLDVGSKTVRGYVRNYVARGIVNSVPAREATGALGAPASSYGLQDIRVAREVFPELSLSEFLDQKVRLCGLGHVVIRDWDQWVGSYTHTCQDCGAQIAVGT